MTRCFSIAVVSLLLAGVCLVSTAPLHGHATGESYVWLNVDSAAADPVGPDSVGTDSVGLSGRFELRVADLNEHLGLSLGADPALVQNQIEDSRDQVWAYIERHFEIAVDGSPMELELLGTSVETTEGLGAFAHYRYRTRGPVTGAEIGDLLTVRNEMFFDEDRFQRSLLLIEYDQRRSQSYGDEFTAMVFSPSRREQQLDLTNIEGLLRPRDFIWQGVLHIWFGYDHVLFLVALLLTAVLFWQLQAGAESMPRPGGLWKPVPRFKSALWNIVKIVTTFTVAHSITLSLAALGLVRLPSRLVESVIAFSILLVAINNLWPRFRDRTWLVIFFFGLFHGLGFASVMGELPFRMGSLIRVIVAFNIGVELGQLAIVAAVFPILYLLRRTVIYKPVFLGMGSVIIGGLSLYWFFERAFGL